MKLIYFSSQQETRRKNLLAAIRETLPALDVIAFTDWQSLYSWLKVPPRDFFAVILEPHDCRTLIQLIELKDFFVDRKMILSVPDNSYQSIAFAHKMGPHYMLSACDGHLGVLSVLDKWLDVEQAEGQWIEEY